MDYDFDYYSGRDLFYPSLIKKPMLQRNATAEQHRKYADELEDYEVRNDKRRMLVKQYNDACNERMEEFKTRLMHDYDVSREQLDLIWQRAWESGHSAGLQEVYHYFDEYYEFAVKFAKLKG